MRFIEITLQTKVDKPRVLVASFQKTLSWELCGNGIDCHGHIEIDIILNRQGEEVMNTGKFESVQMPSGDTVLRVKPEG